MQNVSSNGILLKKEKTITPIWCKIIPKTNVEQIKDNMREIIFIYTLLKTYFEEKNFKPTQDVSKCFKLTQDISKCFKLI